MRRPDLAYTTTLGSVLNSSIGTFHWRATLSRSTRRAWAPPSRIDIQYPGVETLAAVSIAPLKSGW
jgi:hypothetical protein